MRKTKGMGDLLSPLKKDLSQHYFFPETLPSASYQNNLQMHLFPLIKQAENKEEIHDWRLWVNELSRSDTLTLER